jgi:hypothetical protein
VGVETYVFTNIDAGVMAACAAADVALLVGVLVFSSVLELARRQDASRYSLDDHDTRLHVVVVVRMVRGVIYSSSAGGSLGLLAMAIDSQYVRVLSLWLSVITVIAFGTVAILVVRWLWR